MMKVIKSFLAGLTLGILFAPQSGSKTRKRLKRVFKDYKDEAKDHLADAAGAVESKAHNTKKAIQNL
jgi:gas vesicle protein